MPLDPELATLFAARAGAPPAAPLWELTPAEARLASGGGFARPPRPAGLTVTDCTIPGAGGDLAIRIYRHEDTALTAPVVLYFHGGGWVICDVDTHDASVAALALASGCTWISVDYRRSPETQFPGPLEDCVAATTWVSEHADELGLAPARLAVAGDSAGGNMAAVTCILARDNGGPRIDLQLLVYPVIDTSQDTTSYDENGAYGLSRESMAWFLGHYLGDAAADDWRAAPLRAPDLSGLPPAIVVAAELDVLRDEAVAYAGRLRDAGVDVALTIEPGMIHGFWLLPVARGTASLEETARAVGRALGPLS
jgi:acetyl esterase